jgi:hypothetical protein
MTSPGSHLAMLRRQPAYLRTLLEAAPGFEPGYGALQAPA